MNTNFSFSFILHLIKTRTIIVHRSEDEIDLLCKEKLCCSFSFNFFSLKWRGLRWGLGHEDH